MPVAMPEEEEEEEPDYIPKTSKRRSRDVNDDYEVEGREDAAAREAETNDLREARQAMQEAAQWLANEDRRQRKKSRRYGDDYA